MSSAPGPVLREITIRQGALRRQQHGRPYWGATWMWRAAVIALALVLAGGGIAVGRFVLHGSTMSLQAETAPLFQSAYALQQRASALQKSGDLATAERDLTQAEHDYLNILKKDPTNKFAYYDLGVIYATANQSSAASLSYEKALLVDPNYQPALYNLAYLESQTDPTTAIALYEKLQKLNPQNPAAVAFNLGLVMRSLGRVSQGNEELNYAIKLDPTLASRVPAKYRPITTGTTPAATTTS